MYIHVHVVLMEVCTNKYEEEKLMSSLVDVHFIYQGRVSVCIKNSPNPHSPGSNCFFPWVTSSLHAKCWDYRWLTRLLESQVGSGDLNFILTPVEQVYNALSHLSSFLCSLTRNFKFTFMHKTLLEKTNTYIPVIYWLSSQFSIRV